MADWLINWKTTLAGVAAIAGAIAAIATAASKGTLDQQSLTTAIGVILAGVTGVVAKDA
jgi:hypothetical protein